jgi:hypothetical protein
MSATGSTDAVVFDMSVARSQRPLATGPMIDTSDDPTGAALVWPVVMFVFWALVVLGIVLVW